MRGLDVFHWLSYQRPEYFITQLIMHWWVNKEKLIRAEIYLWVTFDRVENVLDFRVNICYGFSAVVVCVPRHPVNSDLMTLAPPPCTYRLPQDAVLSVWVEVWVSITVCLIFLLRADISYPSLHAAPSCDSLCASVYIAHRRWQHCFATQHGAQLPCWSFQNSLKLWLSVLIL